MVSEIITIKDYKFIPTANTLAVPEFLQLWKKVKNPELYFLFLHNYYFPISAYSELPEGSKWNEIKKDFPIDDENPYFLIAKEKAEKLYATTIKEAFLSTKTIYENFILGLKTQNNITFGKDGNSNDIRTYLKESESLMRSYTAVEKLYKESIASYGSRDLGFDNETNYQDIDMDLN